MLLFSNMLGFEEILLGEKKYPLLIFTSFKPKCLDIAIVTLSNKSVLNVF